MDNQPKPKSTVRDRIIAVKENTKIVTFDIPLKLNETMNTLVRYGYFMSKSELVRTALINFINNLKFEPIQYIKDTTPPPETKVINNIEYIYDNKSNRWNKKR